MNTLQRFPACLLRLRASKRAPLAVPIFDVGHTFEVAICNAFLAMVLTRGSPASPLTLLVASIALSRAVVASDLPPIPSLVFSVGEATHAMTARV